MNQEESELKQKKTGKEITSVGIISWIFILILALYTLNKASDYFTRYAEEVGIFFRLPSFVIGITIVSLGTSMPELVTGIVAAMKGGEATSLVAANIIGSNITNILLVIGLASVIARSVRVRKDLVKLDLPLLSLATAIFVLLLAWDLTFSFTDALIALGAYGVYLWYTFTGHERISYSKPKEKIGWKAPVGLVVSTFIIWIGAKYTVDAVLALGVIFHIKAALLSLTVVAFGTSLPEVFVTLAAVRKKQFEVAIGNIFGSNIINLLFVGAIPALITPLVITVEVLMIGIPFLIVSTLLYVIVSLDREVQNFEGAMFLFIYLIYLLVVSARMLPL